MIDYDFNILADKIIKSLEDFQLRLKQNNLPSLKKGKKQTRKIKKLRKIRAEEKTK